MSATGPNSTQSLPNARKEYELQLFCALFDFHRMLTLTEQMRKIVVEKVSFTPDSLLFVENLKPKFTEWQEVADKFRPQLTRLLLSGDKAMLKQRLDAATEYYLPLIALITLAVANHPCRSKNKADVSDFEPLLNDLFLGLHEKIHLMRSILKADNPSSESLLQARNTFVAPMADLQPIMEKPAKKQKTPKAPKVAPQHVGERWMVEDDLRLRELFIEGTTVPQLAQEFNRTQGSIRARLKKLRLMD